MTISELGGNYDRHLAHQEMMFDRLVESQERMFNRLEKMLCRTLVQSQSQMVEILRSSTCTACHNNLHQHTADPTTSNIKQHEGDYPSEADDDNDSTDQDDEQVGQHPPELRQLSDIVEHPTESEEPSSQVISADCSFDGCQELYKAAASGDWKKGSEFFKRIPLRMSITKDEWRRVLRIAVSHKQLTFLEEIVKLMPPAAVIYKTTKGGITTALHVAAMYGYREAAEVLVKVEPGLTQIPDKKGRVPLQLAAQAVTVGQKGTVKYLYSQTKNVQPSPFLGNDGARLLCSTIDANCYDIALSIVKSYPELVVDDICGLESITQRPFSFRSGAKMNWWQRKIYSLLPADEQKNATKRLASIQRDVPLETSSQKGIHRDVENLLESSQGTQVGADDCFAKSSKFFSTTYEGILSMVVSVYHMPYVYLTRVLQIKRLYNQKLMHDQAFALVSEMFAQLKIKMDRPQIVKYFRDNSHVIKTAIKHGTSEVVEECLDKFPYLIWYDLGGQTMIQMAIAERNEKMFDLICKTSKEDMIDLVSRKDRRGNTILHHVAKLAPLVQLNSVCGTALQVQRELQWFKGVERIIREEDKVKRNRDGETSQYIFTKEHKNLVEKGGEWMKDTSGSCMVVAALVATVAFAAIFTVPGGNISDSNSHKNGNPVFLGRTSFTVFVVADALALFSSITSVFMFLAIYTSRHAEQDFYKSLPKKLIIGLATLFLSMATILVAFGASLFIVLGDKFAWAPIPIAVLSGVPLTLFIFLQLPLFVAMVRSTFFNRLLRKHRIV